MTAQQLTHLVIQAQRLSSWLARDLTGWAPAGMDLEKARRIYDKAEQRLGRRRGKLAARLRQHRVGAILERFNV